MIYGGKKALAILEESAQNPEEMMTMLAAIVALGKGQKDILLPANWTGVSGKVVDAFNEVGEYHPEKHRQVQMAKMCLLFSLMVSAIAE